MPGTRVDTDVILPFSDSVMTARAELNVKSPVEGDFSNTQLLYIEKKGYEWIKYTLNGSDPETNGADYSTPVEIRRYGTVLLKIAAKPVLSDKVITREITYRVNTKAPLKNIPPSGIYSSSINIKSNLNDYNYCLEERMPTSEDPVFNGELLINPVYGGVKYSTVRLRSLEPDGADFRYFYIIDDRLPANPIIECTSRLPDDKIVDISITGPDYADIFYTLDGSTPVKSSTEYNDTFSLDIPDEKNAGSLIIKARAVSLNGKSGNVVSRIFTYDTQKPEVPDVSINKDQITGLYKINYDLDTDEKLYYKLDGQNEKFTEVKQDDFFLDIPEGMKKEFTFIFKALDSAGNWSDSSAPISIVINKIIPDKPVVSILNDYIVIENSGDVEYSYIISLNGKELYSSKGIYNEPVFLSDNYKEGASLDLNLYIKSENNNTYTEHYRFHKDYINDVKEAVIFSRKAEDIYSGSEVEFYAYPDGINDTLFYYLTEDDYNGEKNTIGPVETDGHIIIKGTENRKIDYFLEVFSYNKTTEKKSKISSYNFTIDNEKPETPYIIGIESGSVTNDRVIITPSNNDDDVIFLNYSHNKEDIGPLFSNSSIIFNKKLIFDTETGNTENFYFMTGAGDSAGNSSINEDIFSFTIDKKPPVIDDISFNNEQIKIESSESLKYYYETGLKGSFIKEPDTDSKFFTDTLGFKDISRSNGSYIIKILPVDAANNRMSYPFTFSYVIANNIPAVFPAPVCIINERSRKVSTYWKNNEYQLYYRINNDSWEKYERPFSSKYSSGTTDFSIDYYIMDNYGNKSEIKQKSISLPAISDKNLAEGIDNNNYYKTDLELKPASADSLIRYEISTDKILPPNVTVFSPVLPEKLPFIIEEGESINFVVSLKEFNGPSDKTGGAEQVLRFTIDKQLPEPPEIDGITDGEYYLTDCKAFFKPTEYAVYYSLSSALSPNGDFYKYSDPFEINSPDGTYSSFVIKAYTQDYAGNKSSIKEWNLTIDKEIIYVSSDGKDYYEGTRSWPFASLNKAFEHVKLSKRKTIFIEEGYYSLNTPVVIDEAVTVYGGFKKGSWFEKTGETNLGIDDKFPGSNPAFYIYGGSLTVDNIDIKNDGKLDNSIFFMNKGNLNISNCNLDVVCKENASIITQNYGKLNISSSTINGIGSNSPLINSDYGIVNVSNTDINASSDFDNGIILNGTNCFEYNIKSSVLSCSDSRTMTGLSFQNSNINIKSATFKSDKISVSSTAIEIVDSKLSLMYSRIFSDKSNRLSRTIVSEDSVINVNGNNFQLDSSSGIIGFNLTGGNCSFFNNHFISEIANDFTYVFLMNGGTHDIETNILKISGSDDIINLRSKNAAVDFLQNTVIVSAGSNKTIMFKSEGNSVNRIINNIITQREDDIHGETNVIHDTSERNMISFKNNCIYGWDKYLDGSTEAESLIDLDLVDGIYAGGRFSDNFEEDPEITFTSKDDTDLSEESKCIDSGYDLKNILNNNHDIDGDIRPNKTLNSMSSYDIGADEYY